MSGWHMLVISSFRNVETTYFSNVNMFSSKDITHRNTQLHLSARMVRLQWWHVAIFAPGSNLISLLQYLTVYPGNTSNSIFNNSGRHSLGLYLGVYFFVLIKATFEKSSYKVWKPWLDLWILATGIFDVVSFLPK